MAPAAAAFSRDTIKHYKKYYILQCYYGHTHKSSNNETVVVQQRCAVEKRERASALLRPHLRFPPELFWFITYTSNDLHKCGEVFQQLSRHRLMKLFVTVVFFENVAPAFKRPHLQSKAAAYYASPSATRYSKNEPIPLSYCKKCAIVCNFGLVQSFQL